MRAGRLDEKIRIQRKTVTQSDSGEPIETWTNLDARRPAQVAAVKGDEKFTDPAISAAQQTQFTIRYSANIADLSPLDRILYPVPETSDIPATSIYDVLAVFQIGRREGLRILTNRKTDVS